MQSFANICQNAHISQHVPKLSKNTQQAKGGDNFKTIVNSV